MSIKSPSSTVAVSDSQPSSALYVGSLEKGFRVLSAFGSGFPALGVTEIALRTGLDKSAAQRFSNTLHQLGFLEKDSSTRRYRPGRRLMELAYLYMSNSTLGAAAMPRLIEAGATHNTTVNLVERDDLSMIYTVRIPHVKAPYDATVPGRRIPVYCSASGIAVMSRLNDDEVLDILERSTLEKQLPTTITDPNKIMKQVVQARRRGFAQTYAQQLEREISIAAPILDARKRPIGAVQIPVYTPVWKKFEATEKLGPLAVETADAISGALVASEQDY
ncbi:MAG: IclR family transcriptional regulator [Rhodospirillales bacterium]